jgi:hypothetical protein
MIQGIYDIRCEHAREYGKLAQQKYQGAVRPIYGIVRPGVAPKHIGSSVLLSVSGTKFLVTAGHVTDSAKITTLHVAGTKELIPFSFDAGLTTNPDIPRFADVYDFSVCVLSDITQRDLGDVRYITEKEIYKSAPLSGAIDYAWSWVIPLPKIKGESTIREGTSAVQRGFMFHFQLMRLIPSRAYPTGIIC